MQHLSHTSFTLCGLQLPHWHPSFIAVERGMTGNGWCHLKMGGHECFCSSHHLTARGSSEPQALEISSLPDAIQFQSKIWHMQFENPVIHTTLLAAAFSMQQLITDFTATANEIMIDVAAQRFLHRQGKACLVCSGGAEQSLMRIATSSVPSTFISVKKAQVRCDMSRCARLRYSQRVSAGAAANVHTCRRLQPPPVH